MKHMTSNLISRGEQHLSYRGTTLIYMRNISWGTKTNGNEDQPESEEQSEGNKTFINEEQLRGI